MVGEQSIHRVAWSPFEEVVGIPGTLFPGTDRLEIIMTPAASLSVPTRPLMLNNSLPVDTHLLLLRCMDNDRTRDWDQVLNFLRPRTSWYDEFP